MKLYEIPQGSRIKAEATNNKGEKVGDFIVFHHIDGAYSYCTTVTMKKCEQEHGASCPICYYYANKAIQDKIDQLCQDSKTS